MSQSVSVILTEQEQRFLFDLVRWSITRGLAGDPFPEPDIISAPPPGILHEAMGAFVTLHKNGQLRGCIGSMMPESPLYQTVASMAWAAAFQDPRFAPVTMDELTEITFDISVLGPLSPCPDYHSIEIGKHGVLLAAHGRSAVFLPQVALEQGWNVEQTLDQLCHKAGIPLGSWKNPDARLYWYEALLIQPA